MKKNIEDIFKYAFLIQRGPWVDVHTSSSKFLYINFQIKVRKLGGFFKELITCVT